MNEKGIFKNNSNSTIVAQAGETLLEIATKYNKPYSKMLAWNDLKANDPLYANQFVYLESKCSRFKGNKKVHVVAEGENMYIISQLYGMKLSELYCRNALKTPAEPAVGAHLVLSGSNKTAPKLQDAKAPKTVLPINAKGKKDEKEGTGKKDGGIEKPKAPTKESIQYNKVIDLLEELLKIKTPAPKTDPISDWLSFFMFTYFTDRDGKFQLKSLAESGFDPLARTCRFMLTEEAHHMFVGETGVGRVVRRTLEVMKEIGSDDPQAVRNHGAVDLPTVQRYMNFWFTSSLDLFGSEVSSNAASSFASGIKGRPDETQYEDHVCIDATFTLETPQGQEAVSLRNAMNEVMRQSYIKDCEIGVKRWNMQIQRAGHEIRLSLPSPSFRRSIGAWAGVPNDPLGKPVSREEYDRRMPEWIPSESDRAFVHSLMKRVIEPGKMAGWIAPRRDSKWLSESDASGNGEDVGCQTWTWHFSRGVVQ